MGKMQRTKGKVGEREVAKILRDYGFNARRGQQFSGKSGDADVVGLDGYHIEVKRQETYKIDDWFAQSQSDAREGEIPIVVFRKNRCNWRVMIELDDFLREEQARNLQMKTIEEIYDFVDRTRVGIADEREARNEYLKTHIDECIDYTYLLDDYIDTLDWIKKQLKERIENVVGNDSISENE